MKISVQWLKEYVDIKIPVEKLAHRLTMAGLEVEGIETVEKDTVLELEITPNRPDCLNMLGIARELSAILDTTLKRPKVRKIRPPQKSCDVSILDRESCLRYIGTVVNNVQVKEAPVDMQKKLKALGLRPINNIVDITNFCLLETGQPLHAFDYDKLIGGKIIVRRARKGEKITTIDGIDRELDPSILVIADMKRPVAIAGVMGGKETEVTNETKNILLESAYFDPILIRRASRFLGLSTDSSYRFERGVDISMVEEGSFRALSLIRDNAEGAVSQHKDLFLNKRKMTTKPIRISKEQIDSLLGITFPITQSKMILKKLECSVKVEDKKVLYVTPPSFRKDIKQRVDIVEEVARIIGYDNLPVSLPKISVQNIPYDPKRTFTAQMRQALVAQGLKEVVTYTLINQKLLEKTNLSHLPLVKVINPLSQDQEVMRPAILPSLLTALHVNFNRGKKDLKFFEIGKIYLPDGEKEVLSIVMTGKRADDWRSVKKEENTFYDIKGVLDQVFQTLQVKNVQFILEQNGVFAKGQGGKIVSLSPGEQSFGLIGKISKQIIKNWDFKQEDIYFAQIECEAVRQFSTECYFQAISEYPTISRDVSLAVKDGVVFDQLKKIAFTKGENLLVEIKFLEQYLGEKIPAGYQGLTFSLVYQSSERTLKEEEVNKIHHEILQQYIDLFQVIIR